MTDPTPTRAEVVHHTRPDVTDLTVQEWAAYRSDDAGAVARKLLSENQALRDRAEAAERLVSESEAQRYKSCAELMNRALEAEAELTAARRAEAAAWNDAIEAGWAYIETCLDEPETDADAALISDMEEGFRALRRAAPTEGEA